MKYLIVLVLVLAVFWFWRSERRAASTHRADARSPGAAPQAQDMVQCPVCQVHLPRSDALPGPDGQLYCCAEHRQRAKA